MTSVIRASSLTMLLAFAAQGMASTSAHAGTPSDSTGQEDPEHNEQESNGNPVGLSWSYLYDGGVIPFLYVPTVFRATIGLWAPTAANPRLFASGEGGAVSGKGNEVPTWVVQAGAVSLGLGIVLVRDESRWFHVKGFGEAVMTTASLTAGTKRIVGRRRPDYDPDNNSEDERRSFFSGHTSLTLSSTTYMALYLRYHGFDKSRGDSLFTVPEALSYTALGAAAVYVAYSRVADKRHHLSDVLVGAAVGSASSTAFFYWQESRYRSATSERSSALSNLQLLPDIENRGITAFMRW